MEGRQGPPAGGGMVGAVIKSVWGPLKSQAVLWVLAHKFRLSTSCWNGYAAEDPHVLPIVSLTATETS